jgi:hypothetical protein
MKTIHASLLLGVCLAGTAFAAGPSSDEIPPPADLKNAKLGLWTETIQSTKPPERDVDTSHIDLSGMTPEQRARIEAVLKRQHDQHAAQGNAPASTTRTKNYCLKASDVTKNFGMGGGGRDHDDCKSAEVSRSSSRVALHSECSAEGGHITTDITFGLKSPTETFGEMHTD